MIMKKDVNREHLKNNFLKNIIVRFDYTGIAEVELDTIIAEVKPIFKSAGYTKLREEYLTEMDFELQDPENIEIEGLPIKEIRKKKAYVFANEKKDIECKISTRFALVSIQNHKYIPFAEYSETLFEVVKTLINKVEFLNCISFGIRKVNQCIMKDISKINEYFETDFYNLYGLKKGNKPKIFETKDCFKEEKYNFNLTRMVVGDEYEESVAYQVILDTDIYITEASDINELFSDTSEINIMNEKLFEVYKSAITKEFIEKLGMDNYNDQNIIGVEKNE